MSALDLHRAGWARRDSTAGLRLTPAAAVAAFALMAVAAGIVCLVLTRSTTFQADEWVWAIQRRGGGIAPLLQSWNGHFSLVPVLVYKLLWATVGLRTYVPYRLVITALHITC